MRVLLMVLAGVVCLALAGAAVTAQAPDGPQPPPGEQLGPPDDRTGPPPQHPFGPPRRPLPPPPVVAVLDADRDGELSAEEIQDASAALKTLDKDGDGKLGREEMHPPMRPRERSGDGFGPGRGPSAEFPHAPREHFPLGRDAGPGHGRPGARNGQFPGPPGPHRPQPPQCPQCLGPSGGHHAVHGPPGSGWCGPPTHHGPPPR